MRWWPRTCPGRARCSSRWGGRFVKAVGVGEEITGRVEVIERARGQADLHDRTTVRNEAGEVCLTGTATTYTVPLVQTSR